MTRRIPTVRNGILHKHTEEAPSIDAIAVGSAAWYAWLERHRSFRFEHAAGTFTARKEQRSGGWYWYAYRRQAGRLRTVYLGRSEELSVTRLHVIAAALAGTDDTRLRRMAAGDRMPSPRASPLPRPPSFTPPEPIAHHNLPRQLTSLVGREQEAGVARTLLQRPEVRLLSMVGTAGVGKTRLTLQVATGLLESCPDLKILVTSREVLHLRAEHQFTVPPLALPDRRRLPDEKALARVAAVDLFIQRAQAARPDFQLTPGNAAAIAEICIRLDGLPLAIELAAARIKLLPPQALLARLDQRWALLTSGTRDVPARQQTMRKTIDWSYHLLDAQEQQLFRRLSVFVGGCTLQAVEAVCAALDDADRARQALDGVASLLDKSLLQQSEQEGEEPRLVLLETIREYALEALAACGELGATQHAHAAYYLSLAEEAEAEIEGSQQVRWLERLEREHDNLRAALRWGLSPGPDEEGEQHRELALRFGGALRQFWIIHSHLKEGQTFLERAVAANLEAAPALRAKALISAAMLTLLQGDKQRAAALAEEGLVLYREVGDQAGIAFCLFNLGVGATYRGEHARARSLLEESVALLRVLGDTYRLGWSLVALGLVDFAQGELVGACIRYEEALALFRDLGNTEGMASMLFQLGLIRFYSQGDALTARSSFEEACTLLREVGHTGGVAVSLIRLAEIALLGQDNLATARLQAEEALELFKELSYKGGWPRRSSCLRGWKHARGTTQPHAFSMKSF